jgi:hypothetical protein
LDSNPPAQNQHDAVFGASQKSYVQSGTPARVKTAWTVRVLIGHWLDGAATPLARVLDKLTAGEQEAFLKAMDLLETELHRQDSDG